MSELTKPNQLNKLESVQEIAKGLVDFIKQTGLSVKIQGRQYIQVDAWQFLSIPLSLMPIITKVENIGDGTELKYRAECELMQDGVVISTGIGICSNKEYSKKKFDEYAICSMAQTRAIGKAYRNRFGFIAKLAGFEPTPMEEMDEVFNKHQPAKPPENSNGLKKKIGNMLMAINQDDKELARAQLNEFGFDSLDSIKTKKEAESLLDKIKPLYIVNFDFDILMETGEVVETPEFCRSKK